MPGREKLYICSDVDLPQHPRIMACEDPGGCLGLWQALTAYAREHMTDGKVPKRFALGLWGDQKRNGPRLVDMVRTGLLSEDENEYEVLRYSPRNQTKADVEESRRKARERMQKKRAGSVDVRPNESGTDGEQLENRRLVSPGTTGESVGDVPSSPSYSLSGSSLREGVQGEIRSPVNATDDGAFGLAVDAWRDGVRLVTDAEFHVQRGGVTQALVSALVSGCKDSAVRIEWARTAGSEWARASRAGGGKLTVFQFVDWLNAGRPQRFGSSRVDTRQPPAAAEQDRWRDGDGGPEDQL